MKILLLSLVIFIIITALRTFTLSMASHRTEGLPQMKLRAKMNIWMGTMFLAIALLQALSLSGNWIRSILLLIIAALGLFNLFAGWSNLLRVRRLEEEQKQSPDTIDHEDGDKKKE
ncbi:YtpI-like protein [Marininema mesophilum]|uniref:YtpI-like protein n=1 Tax=Marininema mesophilum TaxID=1048340 RepID=A0A1H2XXY1_9BACL|nr:YtpI family protein [Marininema mesophilum]SDW97284.1 YtpI-like protein [Marininema mesophilum]